MRKLLLAIGVVVLAAVIVWAAGPMPDTFFVHFTDPVSISDVLTLPPGDYKFQRITHPTDPAVFTIINSDTHKVLGATPPAHLASSGAGSLHDKSMVILDQANGREYLDTAILQGKGVKFEFPVPSDVRQTALREGKQIKIEAATGGID